MNSGKTVFAQIMAQLPLKEFHRCVARYDGEHKVKSFSCLDHFLSMAFAQLTFRESLRDIEACLRAMQTRLYHMGFRCSQISRNTLANANQQRDWRIYADLAQGLITRCRALYAGEELHEELNRTVFALDSTVIELCLTLFPWAPNKKGHAAIKLHTLLDLNGHIPTFLHVSDARESDVAILDQLPMLPGAFYVMDRGYIHFKRLYRFVEAQSFFVIRSKRKMRFQRVSSRTVDKATGLRSDQTIRLTGVDSANDYPVVLRKVRYLDAETGKYFVFLTNHFQLEARDITLIYKSRWQIELFFKWIKQHLRIKAFYGTSPNAVKVQIWIAVCVYLLLAILKKENGLEADLHKILQVASLTVFEKIPILEAFGTLDCQLSDSDPAKQLILFE